MTRYQAASIHFVISLAVATIVVIGMILIWYPPPLFQVLGGFGLMFLIFGVDVVLGPTLTLIIFKPGKWGLKFDLACIAAFQIAALIYGLYVVSVARPAYLVFVKDRFELVRVVDLDPEQVAQAKQARFQTLPQFGPQYIGVTFPADHKERTDLTLQALMGGPDIHLLPKYYADYATVTAQVASTAKPLSELVSLNPAQAATIADLPGKLGVAENQLGFHAMRARRADVTVVVNKATGEPLKVLQLTPWK